MRIDTLTLFPDMYSALSHSILKKAQDKELFSLNAVDIRTFSTDKHKKCDDTPFGGGAGMVMTPQPLHDAICGTDPEHEALRIYLSPKGKTLNQQIVEQLAALPRIMLISGSYEGIDQRVIDLDVDMELSIGDYVLTSGDFAAMVVIDAIVRYIPGVLGSDESTDEESFSEGLLEYPHYTRPQEFMGLRVPEVLLSGNHKEINAWRRAQALEITAKLRPDLLENKEDK